MNYNFSNWEKAFMQIMKNSDKIVDEVNTYLLEYFKSSFDTKTFDNVQWKPSRNNPDTLVDTGELKSSIKTVYKSMDEILIQSNTPYSAIHNYGGEIKITDKMRKFFWAKFSETKDNAWKYMALSKSNHITIPQRQFMGNTPELEKQVKQIILNVLTNNQTI